MWGIYGQITRELWILGFFTVIATYDGDDKYNAANGTAQLEVSIDDEYDMNVTSTSEDGKVTVEVDLPEDATGTVTVTDQNGNKYTVPVEDGKATVEISGLPVGENNLTV